MNETELRVPSGDTLSQAELSSECNLWAVFSTQYSQQATVHWRKPFTKSTKSFITFRNVGKKGFYFHIIPEEFLGCLFGIHLFVFLNHKCLLFALFSFLAEIFHTLSKCLLLSADFTKALSLFPQVLGYLLTSEYEPLLNKFNTLFIRITSPNL